MREQNDYGWLEDAAKAKRYKFTVNRTNFSAKQKDEVYEMLTDYHKADIVMLGGYKVSRTENHAVVLYIPYDEALKPKIRAWNSYRDQPVVDVNEKTSANKFKNEIFIAVAIDIQIHECRHQHNKAIDPSTIEVSDLYARLETFKKDRYEAKAAKEAAQKAEDEAKKAKEDLAILEATAEASKAAAEQLKLKLESSKLELDSSKLELIAEAQQSASNVAALQGQVARNRTELEDEKRRRLGAEVELRKLQEENKQLQEVANVQAKRKREDLDSLVCEVHI